MNKRYYTSNGGTLGRNTAPGENADKPRNAFFWGQYWVAKPGIPDQVIYDIVKVTQEPTNKEMLGKVMNLWAVSGLLTRDGRPLLANDPHLAVATPSVFYPMGLETDGEPVFGSTATCSGIQGFLTWSSE